MGEERKRVFEHRVVVTNPNGVSEVERARRDEVQRRYEEYLGGPASAGGGDDEAHMARVNEFMAFEWQDAREQRANALLDHYAKEQNFDMAFNSGFHDAIVYGEEMYICDIVGGEPLLTRLDSMCVHAFRRGDGCRLEDADVVVIESYWSPGKVTDWFHGSLSKDDLRRLDGLSRGSGDGEVDADGAVAARPPGGVGGRERAQRDVAHSPRPPRDGAPAEALPPLPPPAAQADGGGGRGPGGQPPVRGEGAEARGDY